ncbi:hypothetical protein [Streptomyces sp. NPDC001604]|uniref:hypothetical protein n=1 Tax=Streptomyces sp. NPDC001604 TaxID=3364593 RepID=UPI0036B6E73A
MSETPKTPASAPSGNGGPPCGNNPNFKLSPGDQQAVDEFRAYLKRRRAGGPPERYP